MREFLSFPNMLFIVVVGCQIHCSLNFDVPILCNESKRLVEETLEPLDPDRRAFRLVGGVLVRHFDCTSLEKIAGD